MARPGVSVFETPLSRSVQPPLPTETYGAFIGTALRGPTNPTRVGSWSEFVTVFGGFASKTTLPIALYQYFLNGGRSAYVARVIAPDAVPAWRIFSDGDPSSPDARERIRIDAITAGLWGNQVSFQIFLNADGSEDDDLAGTFDLALSEDMRGSRVAVERFANLSMNPEAPRYFANVINSPTIGSKLVTVTDLSDPEFFGHALKNPTSGAVYLHKGTDGEAVDPVSKKKIYDYATAFEKFDEINALLLLNIPGETAQSTSLLPQIDSRGDTVLIVDPDENTPVVQSGTRAGVTEDSSLPPNGSVGGSSVAVYYPWIYVVDPSPDSPRGAVVKVPPGASVMGMILRTDSSRGIFKAPAGMSANLVGAVATERRLSSSDLDILAERNINTIRPVPGVGIAVMGARTRTFSTAKYLSVRRTLNYVKRRAALTSEFALFEPNTPGLWEQLRVANGAWLSELWQQGGLAGTSTDQAFYVKCDASINPAQSRNNGEIHVEIGVAPVFPSEFVIIRVGQFEADASVVVTEEG